MNNDYQQVLDHMFDLRLYEYVSRKAYLVERSNPNRDPAYDLRNIEAWRRSYENIRDASWPPCDTPEDFASLPLHIQQECINQHHFSADIWLDPDLPFESFQSDPTWQLDEFDLIRLKLAIVDNLDAIRNRSVIDFGTHIGLFGAVCLHNDAKNVIITNVRDDCLDIADELLEMCNPMRTRFASLISDINNLDETGSLCEGRDTVILAAIMNIVTDHYGIMRAIANAAPRTIIIQNWHPTVIANSAAPLVYWWLEDTTVAWKGYHKTNPEIRVGCPNKAWFDTVLADWGYRLKKHTVSQLNTQWSADSQNQFEFLTLVYER